MGFGSTMTHEVEEVLEEAVSSVRDNQLNIFFGFF